MLKSWEWLGTAGNLGQSGGAGAGAMAHRKGLMTARMGSLIALGLLLAILMAGRVVLLNQVTNMRVQKAHLLEKKEFLETQHAALRAELNRATRPEVICARAERELGLIQPRVPDPVLVRLRPTQRDGGWRLPDWLPVLAGGEVAHAQGVPAKAEAEGMIRLRPQAAGTAERTGGDSQ